MSKRITFLLFSVLLCFMSGQVISMEEPGERPRKKAKLIEEQESHTSALGANLTDLPDEVKLQIIRDYLTSPKWHEIENIFESGPAKFSLERAKDYFEFLKWKRIKSVFDIDKFIKSSSLAQISKDFKNLALDPTIKFSLIKKFVQENPQLAIDDLIKAISDEDLEMIQNLIKAGVNVNGIGEAYSIRRQFPPNPWENTGILLEWERKKSTPLESAIDGLNIEIIMVLLKAGANPDLTSNPSEETPLLLAINNSEIGDEPTDKDENADKIVSMLLQSGANPNLKGYKGNLSPLYGANILQLYDIIKLLLDYGANPLDFPFIDSDDEVKQIIKNHPYDKLLLDSVQKRHIKTLQWLIEPRYFKLPNFNINVQDSDGHTALMFAVDNNFIDIVEYLLKHQADPNIISKNGKTALSIAQDKIDINKEEQENDYVIIKLLKEYGAK